MALNNITTTLTVPGSSAVTISSGTEFTTSTTETSRVIIEHPLAVDFKLTHYTVIITGIEGATEVSPGVIRIYQKNNDANAALVDVYQIANYSNDILVNIEQANEVNRTIVVDAWDPAASGANNTCSIAGKVILHGEPIIATAGGTA